MAGAGWAERYALLRQHYRDPAVAGAYDRDRFTGARRRRRNQRELAAVARALARADVLGPPASAVLDMPCGTGRLFAPLGAGKRSIVGADFSPSMLTEARRKMAGGSSRRIVDLVQCEAEHLPFRPGSFECVVSLRFMFHLDRSTRQAILSEMARVTRRWLVIDVRHKYTTRYLTRRLRKRLAILRAGEYRFSSTALERELRDAGLRPVGIFPSRRVLRWFSDKWFVLAEVADARVA